MWNKLLILLLFISSFVEGQFLQRSNAPKDSLIQHIFDKRGREIYQDTSGINLQNVWFAPDNGQGKKHRPIQEGRIYNFTGVESVIAQAKIFTGNLYTYAFWFNTSTPQSFNQIILHPDFDNDGVNVVSGGSARQLRIHLNTSVSDLVIDGAYEFDEWNRFVVTYDGVTCNVYKNGNTTPIGTVVKAITFSSLISNIGTSAILTENPFKLAKAQESNSVWSEQDIIDDYNGALITKGSIDNFLYWGDEEAGLISYDALRPNGNDGIINLGGSSESSFHITSDSIFSAQNEFGYNIAGTDPLNLNALIPIDQSGRGNSDVLENIVSKPQHGQVRYETSIEPTLLIPDGIIKLTHPNLTGITITSSEGTSTPSKSGNDILLTSGNLRELILSNNDRYQFSEFTGDTIFNIINSDHLLIDLNGSAINPFGNDTSAYPYNQLNGYWSDSTNNVKAPIETDFYNTLIPGSSKVINNSGDVYDRNFADAPALEAANVHVDENITYDSITADFTKFYRNTETGIVRDLIVNSNFPEPISGSSNLRSRIRNYIQRKDQLYNFSGIENVNISGVPDFERTSTFYYKAVFTNTGAGGGNTPLWDNLDFGNNSRGLSIICDSPISGAKVRILLYHENTSDDRIEVATPASFLLDEKHTLEVWYDGSSTASGITVNIDGSPIVLSVTVDNLVSTILTSSNGYAFGKYKNSGSITRGYILNECEFWIDGALKFNTECANNGDLTCVNLDGDSGNGVIDLSTTPREDFFITE